MLSRFSKQDWDFVKGASTMKSLEPTALAVREDSNND